MRTVTAKTITRVTAFVIAAAMVLSGAPLVVHAEDSGGESPPTYPAELSMSANIKQDADAESIKTALESKFKTDNKDYPIDSFNWTDGIDFSTQSAFDVTVNYTGGTTAVGHISTTAIPSTGAMFEKALSTIKSTDSLNSTQNTLLGYVNKDLNVIATGSSEYTNALGTAPSLGKAPAFTWKQCDKVYDPSGNTYTFTQDFNGKVLTKTLTVNSADYDIGKLSIDYTDNTVNTTSNMKWSLTKKNAKWSNCSNDMKIQSSWYDKTVYFYIPESKYADASEIVSLYIPETADKPTTKLELTSTSHSVTINNLWDYDYCEFKINDGNWRTSKGDSYTFSNLSSNKSYTVSIRTKADKGSNLASDALTGSIKTKEAITTKVEVTKNYTGNIGYIDAVATIEPSISSKTMRGSLDSSDFTKFSNLMNSYDEKFRHVETSLVIDHYSEDDDSVFNTINFSMPMSSLSKAITNGALTVNYRCDFGRIYLDNDALTQLRKNSSSGTISTSIQKVNSFSGSSMKWLKDIYDDGADVYKLSVSCGSKTTNVQYFIPYTLTKNQTVHSLNVYFVDSKGEHKFINFDYDSTLGGIVLNLDENGYIAINSDKSNSTYMPFTDVPAKHWARNDIQYCYNKGLFTGTSATKFSPDGTVSKAQIITMLARLDGCSDRLTGTIKFSDVKSTDWYAPYAQWAYNKGIVTTKTFNGNDSIQRQDIAKLMYIYLQKTNHFKTDFTANSVAAYADVKSINSTNRTAVQYMKYIGVMNGTGKNNFSPAANVTRAQMSAILVRLAKIVG